MKIILQAEEINLFGLQNKIKRGGLCIEKALTKCDGADFGSKRPYWCTEVSMAVPHLWTVRREGRPCC